MGLRFVDFGPDGLGWWWNEEFKMKMHEHCLKPAVVPVIFLIFKKEKNNGICVESCCVSFSQNHKFGWFSLQLLYYSQIL